MKIESPSNSLPSVHAAFYVSFASQRGKFALCIITSVLTGSRARDLLYSLASELSGVKELTQCFDF